MRTMLAHFLLHIQSFSSSPVFKWEDYAKNDHVHRQWPIPLPDSATLPKLTGGGYNMSGNLFLLSKLDLTQVIHDPSCGRRRSLPPLAGDQHTWHLFGRWSGGGC